MALTSEDIKQISDLLEATLDTKLESKLEPIKNDLVIIKVDLDNVKLHTSSSIKDYTSWSKEWPNLR